jgi:hypothetical protein
VGLGPTRPLAGLGGFRDRCRRPTLGLPFHKRMASGSNARRTVALATAFQADPLPLGQPSSSGRCRDRTCARLSP